MSDTEWETKIEREEVLLLRKKGWTEWHRVTFVKKDDELVALKLEPHTLTMHELEIIFELKKRHKI